MIVDLIIIGILVISILMGIKIGLIKSLINLAAIFLSIVIAMLFCRPLAGFLTQHTKIDETIQSTIVKTIIGEENEIEKQEGKSPNEIQKYIEQASTTITNEAKSVLNNTEKELTNNIMIGISFAILYLLSSIIILIIKQVSSILTSLPVIKQFDKLGGGIIGAINAIIIVYIALGVIKIFGATINNPNLNKEFNNSHIAKIMLDKNAFERIIVSISKK